MNTSLITSYISYTLFALVDLCPVSLLHDERRSKATFSVYQRWLLNTGLTVFVLIQSHVKSCGPLCPRTRWRWSHGCGNRLPRENSSRSLIIKTDLALLTIYSKTYLNRILLGLTNLFSWDRYFAYAGFKLQRHLVDGAVKSLWFRQVFGLLRVRFRQVFGLLRVRFRLVFVYSGFGLDRCHCNTVVSNHVNSDHVPSFSCLDVWTPWQTTSDVYAIIVTTSAYHSRRCGRL
jgi:hypothetical protein